MSLHTTEYSSAEYSFAELLIDGQWRNGQSNLLRVYNPYNQKLLTEIALASVIDVDTAFLAASKAQPDWARMLPSERAEVMRSAVRIMELRHAEIVNWLIEETGSVRLKAEFEWSAVRSMLLEAASLPTQISGRILSGDIPDKEHRIYRKPIGVVTVISPWNWPMHLGVRAIAPALALGNSVVLKPALETPITGGLLLAKIFQEAGLPDGVLNIVIGTNEEIGDAVVQHTASRVLSFTGSSTVGRRINLLANNGSVLKHVSLELGGNNPLVVLDDADIDTAVNAAVVGRFLHQGQICVSANRIIVDASLYERFTEGFVARVSTLKYGNPQDAETIIGPLIGQRHLDRLLGVIAQAKSDGARLRTGAEPEGLVLPPHVFDCVSPDMQLGRNEIFGPVAPLILATDEADALRQANDTEYGLTSAVFTQDIARGMRFAEALEAGMTHINDMPAVDLANMPFGGVKNSGSGRFGAEGVIAQFTREHWVSQQKYPRQYPF